MVQALHVGRDDQQRHDAIHRRRHGMATLRWLNIDVALSIAPPRSTRAVQARRGERSG